MKKKATKSGKRPWHVWLPGHRLCNGRYYIDLELKRKLTGKVRILSIAETKEYEKQLLQQKRTK